MTGSDHLKETLRRMRRHMEDNNTPAFEVDVLEQVRQVRRGVEMLENYVLTRLSANISDCYDASELRTLVFQLGLNYENLVGETHDVRVISLVTMADRYGRLPELVAQVRKDRPGAFADT